MFHMLSCFNLKDGERIDAFQRAYAGLVAEMKSLGLERIMFRWNHFVVAN